MIYYSLTLGVVIGLAGLIVIFLINFNKIKYKLLPVFLGILILMPFSYLVPDTGRIRQLFTNPNLDSYDTFRLDQFNHILTDAFTKYPLGIGFAGGGAMSQQAFELFGGDNTYLPEYLGGDSVFFATLQTSGFYGPFFLLAIFAVFIIVLLGY